MYVGMYISYYTDTCFGIIAQKEIQAFGLSKASYLEFVFTELLASWFFEDPWKNNQEVYQFVDKGNGCFQK